MKLKRGDEVLCLDFSLDSVPYIRRGIFRPFGARRGYCFREDAYGGVEFGSYPLADFLPYSAEASILMDKALTKAKEAFIAYDKLRVESMALWSRLVDEAGK